MNIWITNKSTVVAYTEAQQWMPALQQFAHLVAMGWNLITPTLHYGPPPDQERWQILILDNSDQAGALGYHDFTPGGKPIAKVFAKTDQQYQASVTVTLTHELAEMMVDPYIALAAQTDASSFYAYEVGDPVEADTDGFTVDGVLCSDFALPNWFIPGAPKPYDHRLLCTTPLQIRPGGYAQKYVNGQWTQLGDASKADPDRLRARG